MPRGFRVLSPTSSILLVYAGTGHSQPRTHRGKAAVGVKLEPVVGASIHLSLYCFLGYEVVLFGLYMSLAAEFCTNVEPTRKP